MGLLDRINAMPATLPGPSCSIGKLLGDISPGDADELRQVIDAKQAGTLHLAWAQIAELINAEHGRDITAAKLSHHARRLCSCTARGLR